MKEYDLGTIPPQRVWGNEELRFHIRTPDAVGNTVLTAEADPQPQGSIEVIPASNGEDAYFRYKPDEKDTPFSVTFTLSGGQIPAKQTVLFEPMPLLPPERNYVSSSPDEPDRSLYVESREEDAGSEFFNASTEKLALKKVYVSGLDLIFDPGKDGHSFTGYDESPQNIKEMHITADRLIIRQRMHLPQTDVFVTARELIMEGDGEDAGAIDTTPKPHKQAAENGNRNDPENPVPGTDGKDGAKGGDIQLNIGSIKLPSGNKPRFILKGANGQAAGEGLPGMDQSAMKSWSKYNIRAKEEIGSERNVNAGSIKARNDRPFVYIKVDIDYIAGLSLNKDETIEEGEDKWPQNGGDAVKPGRAGNGGDGGDFSSSVDIAYNLIDAAGGKAGAKAMDQLGGKHGQPYPCSHVHYKAEMKTNDGFIAYWPKPRKISETPCPSLTDGQSFTAEAGSTGNNGRIAVGPPGYLRGKISAKTSNSWHSGLASLPQIARFIKDAYLYNNRDLVSDYLETYLPALAEEPGDSAMQTELATLRHRLENRLDYFGNPAGWTPLLSLQANLKAYDNEIERAMKTLFLAYWVESVAKDKTKAITGLENSIGQLEDDTQAATQALRDLQSDLPDIQGMVDRLNNQIENQNNQLAHLENRLTVEARDNIEERHAVEFGMSMLTAVTSIIPYGQPALSATGQVTSALVTSQYNPPGQTRAAIGDALASAGAAGLDSAADDIIQAADDDAKESDKLKQAKSRAAKLAHVAANLGPAVENVTASFQNLGASQDEVDVELARLAAQNPEFQEATKQIAKLNGDKVEFASQLTATTQAITTSYNRISANGLAIASYREAIAQDAKLLDASTLRHVAEMKQRALEVLVRYQYYLVKSYESMWLKPYEKANYQLGPIVDRITELLSSSNDGTLTPTEFGTLKALFDDNLDEMLRDLLENLRPEYTATQWLTLSDEDTPDLMKELNEKGETRINLMDLGMVLPDYENVRIADISVADTKGIEVSPEARTRRGTLHVDFTLSGDGTIRSDGDLYVVRHPTISGLGNTGESGLRWGVSYNIERDRLALVKPSSSFTSMLRHLLKDDKNTTDKETQLQFLSQPAAWTDIIISKSVTDASQPIDVQSLTVRFELSYSSAPRNQCVLHVTTRSGHRPLIRCNRTDLNGRDDAYGQMYRIFRRGAQVKLSAPAAYGRLRFSHYEILNAHTLGKIEVRETDHTFDMNDDLIVVCVYDPGWTVTVEHKEGEGILALLVGDIGVKGVPITIRRPGGETLQAESGSKPEHGPGGFEAGYANEAGLYQIQFLGESFDIELSGHEFAKVVFTRS
jgi:hypothetical protein